MSEAMIIFLINLGLSLPDLAQRVQKLWMKPKVTQEDWDEIWQIIEKTPAQYLAEARARLSNAPNPPIP